MTGGVTGRHALLPIPIRLPNQPDFPVEFVVDTGYTDYLTLPPTAVAALNLPLLHRIPAALADDTTIEVSVHLATILWDGAELEVPVLATGRRPLLGAALLEDFELIVQFRDGGLVTIDRI
ncbi:MAG TPA: clan AA aspartic protease [Armatimonadota bacterium]|nr:clan AA aspartic protease [Armatimonadota bacterium]